MSSRTVITMIDDLDGTTGDEVTTVSFGIDNDRYEIELSPENLAALEEVFAPYIAAGRIKSRRRTPQDVPVRSQKPTTNSERARQRKQNKRIRTWARQQGWDLGNRGRIPEEVMAAYEASK